VKSVLVTGAGGALGRAVLAALRRAGGQVITAAGRTGAGEADASVPCDVRDPVQLSAVFQRADPDLVLHLAGTFRGELAELCAVNVEPARNLLDLVRRSASRARVVLIGSAAEYGVVGPGENPLPETHVLMPVSPYGVSKAWQTQLVGFYSSHGVDVVCARVFNLWGPGLSESLFAGRLQRQIDEVLAGTRSRIEVGPANAVRDYLSTEEAAVQLMAIASRGMAGHVYHVASGIPIRVRDWMLQQLEKSGLDASVVQESPGLSNRSGYDVPEIFADVSKTRGLLEEA
jgi:GDP-4-dehydro-6-deoxy-D-mannose reductase